MTRSKTKKTSARKISAPKKRTIQKSKRNTRRIVNAQMHAPPQVAPFQFNLDHDPEKYNLHHKQGARMSYMIFLLILTVCNFLIFIGLVPLLLFIKSDLLVLILAGVGLIFGMLFLYLVRDIEHLEPKHHLFAVFYIPVLSIVNIILLMLMGRLIKSQQDYQDYTIIYASAIYVAMFLLPYALNQVLSSLFKRRR
jgi:hypothetical protein